MMRRAKWLLPIGGIAVLGTIGLLWFTGLLSDQHEVPALLVLHPYAGAGGICRGGCPVSYPLRWMPWTIGCWHSAGAIVALKGLCPEPS